MSLALATWIDDREVIRFVYVLCGAIGALCGVIVVLAVAAYRNKRDG